MSDLGIKNYRFSISWNRMLLGDGGKGSPVNPDGVAFYNALLEEMLGYGITPAATMFHWDLPQNLHDKVRGFVRGCWGELVACRVAGVKFSVCSLCAVDNWERTTNQLPL